ncbi:M3 family metallopeptidase [Solimonas marina]|uniref:oligopeptidase A n=1 Tax=Solimonas marina TaxID=2714601 RepID=A0A970B500_9GAMM|nr:M3 family metallopeptidase [Solimonas marina]NKF22867.1 M3 family metallopeptidase [Solimonas marina]
MDNPLLRDAITQPLPAFAAILPEHAEAALDEVLAKNRAELQALLDSGQTPSWDRLVEPLEDMSDRIQRAWGPVSHLFSVKATADWRRAYNACLPKLTEYGVEVSQSEPLYRAYEALAASDEFQGYDAVRRKVIADALRDFRLSGIGLPPEKKERYKAISLRLSELQTTFEEHLMDAIQAWGKHVTDEAELAGMTDEARQAAQERAKAKNLEGWWLTLDFPSFDAVISYSDNRALRRELYEAYATRASDQGPQAGQFDNSALMEEILALRHELAQLLGFGNYAELSMATKMADTPDEVEAFLVDLAQRAKPSAQADLDALRAFAQQRDGLSDFAPWDAAYYAEKQKEETLGLSDEELRPYFAFDRVVRGMFDVVQRLYGISIEAVDHIETWHPDVTTYALKDGEGVPFGLFYLDPYARAEKRSGAWMDECINRRRTAHGLQQPVAYLTCNFTPPLAGKPALMTHDEVVTLFHEFGHGLHHLLTRVDEASVAGIHGVSWDAVELPSQFMENWCYDPATLRQLAHHWQTDAVMPEAMIDKLRESRRFHAGMATVRQLEFALFDLRLHRDFDPGFKSEHGERVLQLLDRVRDEVAVMKPPAFNRMPWSFSHIFAGGYAAGYYSYKWAEVLSADAFAAFEESRFATETGQRFRDTILAQGGSKEAMDLFIEFRGRKPSIEALLRHNGLGEDVGQAA